MGWLSKTATEPYGKAPAGLMMKQLIEELADILDADEPEALIPFLRNPKDAQTSSLIDEATEYVEKTLLRFAVIRSAYKCVALLTSPPYSWDPDRRDPYGWSPLQTAEDRDDLWCSTELALRTSELRSVGYLLPKWPCGGRTSTCLLWPQDMWYQPLTREAFIHRRGFGSVLHHGIRLLDQRRQLAMGGEMVALTFELLMATPFLFAFDLWTGEPCTHHTGTFWPIPQTALTKAADHFGCSRYPQCLHLVLPDLSNTPEDPEEAWQSIFSAWLCHRLQPEYRRPVKECTLNWSPIRLQDLCRAAIRQRLVYAMVECNPCENYAQRISQVPLPYRLKDFLLYREIWPHKLWDEKLEPSSTLAIPILEPRPLVSITKTREPNGSEIVSIQNLHFLSA
ncbi:hypothetical protein CRM22_007261 [Opisthorchis felineus]|uniref:SOCS box domain-containing protein n=1 Tax=Opisthorchis felineus TaxID=147828 RepID=A0A4V6RGW6_OPIFE|nr:hypothetical protein CRM22_007261 [Opisthorchis felineus]